MPHTATPEPLRPKPRLRTMDDLADFESDLHAPPPAAPPRVQAVQRRGSSDFAAGSTRAEPRSSRTLSPGERQQNPDPTTSDEERMNVLVDNMDEGFDLDAPSPPTSGKTFCRTPAAKPDAPDNASPSRSGARMRICFLCKHSEEDIDLTDPDESRKLTFQNASTTACLAECLCDLCETFLRYHVGTRSRADLHKKLSAGDDETLRLLNQLAWYLCLKRLGASRVSNSRLDEMVQHVDVHKRIFDAVRARVDSIASTGDSIALRPACYMVELLEYVRRLGNPWVNGHEVLPARTENKVCLCVLVPQTIPDKGRYPLKDSVTVGWRSQSSVLPPSLDVVRKLAIDDLPTVKVVEQLIEEFAKRRAILQAVGIAGLPKAMSQASSSAGDKEESVAEWVPPRGATLPSSRGRVSRQSLGYESPPPSSRRARSRSRATTARGMLPGGAGAASGSVGALERTFRKHEAKMMLLAAPFVTEGRQRNIRGKEKIASNLTDQFQELKDRCASACREDMIEDITERMETVSSMLRMVQAMKAKRVEEWDAEEMLPDIDRVAKFLAERDDGNAQEMAPDLRKAQAPLCTYVA